MASFSLQNVTNHTEFLKKELGDSGRPIESYIKGLQEAFPLPKQRGFEKSILENERRALEKKKLREEEKNGSLVQAMWDSCPILPNFCDEIVDSFEIKLRLYQKYALGAIFVQKRVILAHDIFMGKLAICLAAAKCISGALKQQVFLVAPAKRETDVLRQSRSFGINFWEEKENRILFVSKDFMQTLTHESFSRRKRFALIVVDMHEFVTCPKALSNLFQLSGSPSCNMFVGSTAAPVHAQNICPRYGFGDSMLHPIRKLSQTIMPYLHAIRSPLSGGMDLADGEQFTPYPYSKCLPSEKDVESFLGNILSKMANTCSGRFHNKQTHFRDLLAAAAPDTILYKNRHDPLACEVPQRQRILRHAAPDPISKEEFVTFVARLKRKWAEGLDRNTKSNFLLKLEACNSFCKVNVVVDLIKKARKRGHSVLVLSNHRAVVNKICVEMEGWDWNFFGTRKLRGKDHLEDAKAIHSLSLEAKCVVSEYCKFYEAGFNYRATGTGVVILVDRPHEADGLWSVEASAPGRSFASIWLKQSKLDDILDYMIHHDDNNAKLWYQREELLQDDCFETGVLSAICTAEETEEVL